METTYYSINAKRLVVCGVEEGEKVSGGQEAIYCLPHRSVACPQPAGKVLDMEAYRRRATEEMAQPTQQTGKQKAVAPHKHRGFGYLLLDGCATVAIVGFVIGVLIRFFYM